jgi:Spy/CpxP family protein refolding chaperone
MASYATGTTVTWTPNTSDQIWQSWVGNITTGTTTGSIATTDGLEWTQSQVWNQWNQLRPPVQRQDRAEQRRLREELQAQELREAAARRKLRMAQLRQKHERMEQATDRAMELLRSILTPNQRKELEETKAITVEAPSGRRYRVETHGGTVHGNIVEIDEHGCVLARACVAPEMYDYPSERAFPTPDGWVGQVLSLQQNEEAIRAAANWYGYRHCRRQQARAA